MINPRLIIIDGKAYVWCDLVKLRREQIQEIAAGYAAHSARVTASRWLAKANPDVTKTQATFGSASLMRLKLCRVAALSVSRSRRNSAGTHDLRRPIEEHEAEGLDCLEHREHGALASWRTASGARKPP